MIVAIISSEANLKNRARYQEIARRLSLARGVSEPEARALSKEGKVIVWIDGGLHATEVAGAQHTPELAWWLVSSESDEAKRVRDNAILVLMPSMNPDGLDIVRDWYNKNLGTPFETTSPPDIYHHYVGHDNNRDWTMFTQVETQAVARQLYHVWYPQIVYNHHQSGPFPSRIWGPPMKDPVNPNLDPLVVSTINSDRRSDAQALRRRREAGLQLAHALRHLVERQHARRPRLSQHGGLPHRDVALSAWRRRIATRPRRFPRRSASVTRTCRRRFRASTTPIRGWAAAGRSASRSSTC